MKTNRFSSVGAIAMLALCHVAATGQAADRWVLRKVTTSADHNSPNDPLAYEGWKGGPNDWKARVAPNGKVTAERGTFTFEVDPWVRQGRFREAISGVPGADATFEWLLPPEVWEEGQTVTLGGKIHISGPTGAGARGGALYYGSQPVSAYVQVGESQPPDKNPFRSRAPGMLSVSSRDTGHADVAGNASAAPRSKSDFVLSVDLVSVQTFRVFYHYEFIPDGQVGAPPIRRPGTPPDTSEPPDQPDQPDQPSQPNLPNQPHQPSPNGRSGPPDQPSPPNPPSGRDQPLGSGSLASSCVKPRVYRLPYKPF